ncbi:WxL domain-containing protein [Bombilactobacillus bombi]|uniref:WxL domain-containing protein n=1 Tax=Bombilactobacillus bombi TaxID=1303590 RepID=UPI0015E602D2|nr:WxL domain-containing protein [Bombilactobacillus bombi]
MRKFAQAVALGTVAYSAIMSVSPVHADTSAALSGIDPSNIINSAATPDLNDDGSASGQSLAGIGFKDGSLYLYGSPNFYFGTHLWSADLTWDLLPSGANSSGNVEQKNTNAVKTNSIAVGDFRSHQTGNGWTLSVSVTDFKSHSNEVEPVRSMLFHHATLMEGKFYTPINDDAILNSKFNFEPVSNISSSTPNNNLGDGVEIPIYPPSSPDFSNNNNEAVIWSAKNGNNGQPVQGKNVWGLSFITKGDVQLFPVDRTSQIPGDYNAKITWTLSTAAIT